MMQLKLLKILKLKQTQHKIHIYIYNVYINEEKYTNL